MSHLIMQAITRGHCINCLFRSNMGHILDDTLKILKWVRQQVSLTLYAPCIPWLLLDAFEKFPGNPRRKRSRELQSKDSVYLNEELVSVCVWQSTHR